MNEKLYTTNQICGILNVKRNCVDMRAKRLGLKPAMMKDKKTKLFSWTQVCQLRDAARILKSKKIETNAKVTMYRVSVLDENSLRWFVKAAGLEREEADKIVQEYTSQGFIAESRACREEI